MAGEGEVRKQLGETLVIIPHHATSCPLCQPFENKVLIDDVYSGGKADDGDYMLLSQAMAEGLFHPRCRHGLGTYYPELEDIVHYDTEENRVNEYGTDKLNQAHVENMIQKYKRLTAGSIDPENIAKYQAKLDEWENKKAQLCVANSENSGTIKEQNIYAVSTDRAQFERYRNVLKKDAPKTFEDFLLIKYTDSDNWNKIKALVNSKNYLQEQLAYIYNGEKCFIPKHTVFSSKAKVIAGGAAKDKIRCVGSLIKKYGGTAEKWEKKVASIKSDKYLFDVHWYECDGIQYEMKLKHRKEL